MTISILKGNNLRREQRRGSGLMTTASLAYNNDENPKKNRRIATEDRRDSPWIPILGNMNYGIDIGDGESHS